MNIDRDGEEYQKVKIIKWAGKMHARGSGIDELSKGRDLGQGRGTRERGKRSTV